jgi:hypothetical protein
MHQSPLFKTVHAPISFIVISSSGACRCRQQMTSHVDSHSIAHKVQLVCAAMVWDVVCTFCEPRRPHLCPASSITITSTPLPSCINPCSHAGSRYRCRACRPSYINPNATPSTPSCALVATDTTSTPCKVFLILDDARVMVHAAHASASFTVLRPLRHARGVHHEPNR